MTKKVKAVVLASGGLDSSTVLKFAEHKNYDIYVLSFSYGQRHNIELHYLKDFLKNIDYIEHKIALIDMRLFGGSSLTDDIEVPSYDDIKKDIENKSIPNTYVPARNTIFLSYALAYAEIINATKILIGTYSVDYVDYPDCKNAFIKQFNKLIETAIKPSVSSNIKVEAPFINNTKAQIINYGLSLNTDYSKTFSCYNPDKNNLACGKCSACHFRIKAFHELGMTDPAKYYQQI